MEDDDLRILISSASIRNIKNLSSHNKLKQSPSEKQELEQKAIDFVKQKEEERKIRLKGRREFLNKTVKKNEKYKKNEEQRVQVTIYPIIIF
jgi:hypothetical protein